MNKKTVFLGFVSVLLLSSALGALFIRTVGATKTWTVDDDGPADFSTIQAAVNAAGDGDTILVASGTYERVTVKKSVKLIGEDNENTIIEGNGTWPAVVFVKDTNNVIISGFAIRKGMLNEGLYPGVSLENSTGTTISGNVLSDNLVGIQLSKSTGNTISENTLENNQHGIWLSFSHGNVISNNTVSSNSFYGMQLFASDNNAIFDNTFTHNDAQFNSYGAHIDSGSSGNTLYHNNFINNTNQAYDYGTNEWDNGAEGNYWSDYDGEDLDRNGIGDTPYIIDSDSKDRYPLMYIWPDTTPPVADAGPDQIVNEDTMVTFNGSGSWDNAGIASYVWTFTDVTPQTLTGMTSTYTFATPGSYLVTLTVTDIANYSDTDTVTITVLDVTKPHADAGPDQEVGQRTLVTFNGGGSTDNVGIASYVWTFTDVTPETLAGVHPTYTFNNFGNFKVTLNVSDYAGNWDTDIMWVNVSDTTPPSIGVPSRDPPDDPDDMETVTVSVNVSDAETGVQNVTCWYRAGGGPWQSVIMDRTAGDMYGGVYTGEIPGLPAGTDVQYKIVSYDNAGNIAVEDNNEGYYVYAVIPEFPGWTLLLLMLFLLALVVVPARRRIYPAGNHTPRSAACKQHSLSSLDAQSSIFRERA